MLYRQAAASPAVPRFLANLAMVPLPSCGRGADAAEKLLRAKEKETTAGTDLERKRAAEARALVRLPPRPLSCDRRLGVVFNLPQTTL